MVLKAQNKVTEATMGTDQSWEGCMRIWLLVLLTLPEGVTVFQRLEIIGHVSK